MSVSRLAFSASVLLPFVLAQSSPWPQFPPSWHGNSFSSCAAASWPPVNVGSPLIPQAPDAELQAMIAEVDPVRIQNIVTTLANFGTRHTLSSQTDPVRGIGAARDWITAQMEAIAATSNGNMDVSTPSYIQGVAARISFPVRITDVVARINGTTDPNRTYVITGHYDSRRIDIMDYTGDAPGADDDATGVAVLLELARIFATKKPAATMIFAATAGEEQNLYGSTFLAQTLKNASVNVEANLNNDIVGTGSFQPFNVINQHTIRLFAASVYPSTENSSTILLRASIGGENDTPARALGRYVAEVGSNAATDMQVVLMYRPDRFERGGDHESFLEAGFPAVRFTEPNEDFTHQHQDPRVQDGVQYGDLLEYVDFNFTARVAKVNLAAMWSLANAPALPRNVTISLDVGEPAASENTTILDITSSNTLLMWNQSDEELLDSYEVVWRPTIAPQWTHVINVGNVGSAIIPVSKDNVVFGVRSVGKDGKKSPAVFPFPALS